MYQKTSGTKKTLGQKTEDRLMKFILDEPVQIGERIPNEYDLAERFQVGRSTIREAVKGLVSRGVLEVRRGDGTYVISTSYMENDVLGFGSVQDKYQLAMDLFEVRLMLEPEIVTWACQNATEEQIAEAERLCAEVEHLYKQGIDHIHKDIEFHCYLAKLSGNVVVDRLLPVINTAVVTFANITYRSLKEETLTTHREIINSLKRRDAVGARCAMIMHLTYNRQVIVELLEERRKKR